MGSIVSRLLSAIETSSINDVKLEVGDGLWITGSGIGSAALYLVNACLNKVCACSARLPVVSTTIWNQEMPRNRCNTTVTNWEHELKEKRMNIVLTGWNYIIVTLLGLGMVVIELLEAGHCSHLKSWKLGWVLDIFLQMPLHVFVHRENPGQVGVVECDIWRVTWVKTCKHVNWLNGEGLTARTHLKHCPELLQKSPLIRLEDEIMQFIV